MEHAGRRTGTRRCGVRTASLIEGTPQTERTQWPCSSSAPYVHAAGAGRRQRVTSDEGPPHLP
eukprot:scaffold4455_cov132-Isochrysis_galbana.AAC.10